MLDLKKEIKKRELALNERSKEIGPYSDLIWKLLGTHQRVIVHLPHHDSYTMRCDIMANGIIMEVERGLPTHKQFHLSEFGKTVFLDD